MATTSTKEALLALANLVEQHDIQFSYSWQDDGVHYYINDLEYASFSNGQKLATELRQLASINEAG